MICEHFRVTTHSRVPKRTCPPDRFFVAKFLSSRRWDWVAFKHPENLAAEHAMRLVGLLGESIHLEDGFVYADGKQLEFPENLAGLEYVNEIPLLRTLPHATKDRLCRPEPHCEKCGLVVRFGKLEIDGDVMDIAEYNRRAWDHQVAQGNRWTVPVTTEIVAAARQGEWNVVLTPQKPVPKSWFSPSLSVSGLDVLCLASGGGQQAPILAAAGANVTVLDNSPRQLEQDQIVARRDGLTQTLLKLL